MCAVPNMAVYWSSLTSYFPGTLITHFLNYYYYYYYYLFFDRNKNISHNSYLVIVTLFHNFRFKHYRFSTVIVVRPSYAVNTMTTFISFRTEVYLNK